MLIRDEVRIERDLKGQAQESYADKVNSWTKEQLGSARIIDDTDMAPCNPQRQLGHMLPGPQRLEAVLRTFSENFVFKYTLKPGKKKLCYLLPDGTLQDVCVYEDGPTPEYSILNAQWRWEADPDYALGSRTLERDEVRGEPVTLQEAYDLIRDLGPQRAKQHLLDQRADQGLNDPDYRPGFKKTLQTWSEAVRGWRAVLVRPVQQGLISLEQAEKAIRILGGTEDRASWSKQLGKQSGLQLGY